MNLPQKLENDDPVPEGSLDGSRTDRSVGVHPDDPDGDGLTNAEERAHQTHPGLADTDGDGLLDGWEVKGVDGLDLPGLGADPIRKDIFVEMDYMTRPGAQLAPSAEVIQALVTTFDQAPVENYDRTTGVRARPGIKLHLHLDEEVEHRAEIDKASFDDIKAKYFDFKRRKRVFHYMIWADKLRGQDWSGYSFSTPGADFVVTLGFVKGGSDGQKIGTFMHELGHNLGLEHGGTVDQETYKPNHFSVMDYLWQLRGVKRHGARAYDYQGFHVHKLVEYNLKEDLGLSGGGELYGYETSWTYDRGRKTETAKAWGPINWDMKDGYRREISVDLNFDAESAANKPSTLTATDNEWIALNYTGGNIGSRVHLTEANAEQQAIRRHLGENKRKPPRECSLAKALAGAKR